jgi:hypothetical protein
LLGLAFGAEIDVTSRGKPVLVFLDGEALGVTPQNIQVKEGFHEITAKLDAVSASALHIKFVVFDQNRGNLVFDWKKQQADLIWPGEERLKARERALLRNRELTLARQPGMFVLPTVSEDKTYKSADELPFVKEVEVVVPDEPPKFELYPEAEEPTAPLLDFDIEPDDDEMSFLSEGVEPSVAPMGIEAPVFSEDEVMRGLYEAAEEEDPELMGLIFEEIMTAEVEPEDVEIGLDYTSIQIAPVAERSTPKPERIRESGGFEFRPWMVGGGAAVVAGGCFGQAGLQWSLAQGYSERARSMEGSVSGVDEYLFNVEHARKKSGTTRAMIGAGAAVFVSGVSVSFALGKR